MEYTKKDDETKKIREALLNGDTINQVCHDYNLTFPELIQRMSSYGSGIKHSMKYTGEQYIMKHHGHYVIRKSKKYFGTYKSLGDAITVRDWFMSHRWDKRWVNRACRECNIQRCTK